MKTKTIIASILFLASGALAALACDCGKATEADDEQQQSVCNCKAQCLCSDTAEAPQMDEADEEN